MVQKFDAMNAEAILNEQHFLKQNSWDFFQDWTVNKISFIPKTGHDIADPVHQNGFFSMETYYYFNIILDASFNSHHIFTFLRKF